MSKTNLQEKRLQNLRRQLLGKDEVDRHTPAVSSSNRVYSSQTATSSAPIASKATARPDFVGRDLLKIVILSSLVFLIQGALYYLFQNPTSMAIIKKAVPFLS